MPKRYYLGVDGGGTQTRAILADENGCVRGRARAGSANRNHHSRESVHRTLQALFREALADLPAEAILSTVFLGLGGVSAEADRQDLREVLQGIPEIEGAVQVVIENDTLVGLIGGLAGRPGIALVAGTGSACLGVNAHGEQYLCGGWGALADDVGSAPWVGLRAIQAAVRAQDGRQPPTRLQAVVFEFLGLAEPRALISRVHNQSLDRAEMGRLAPRVTEAGRQGDAAAGAILDEAAAGLTELVRVTEQHLFGGSGCEMILVGGLALSGEPFQPLLIGRIQQECPGITLRDPVLTPVQGAVLCALRAGGIPWTPALLTALSSKK